MHSCYLKRKYLTSVLNNRAYILRVNNPLTYLSVCLYVTDYLYSVTIDMKKMKFKPKVLPICFQINIYEPKIYFGKKTLL